MGVPTADSEGGGGDRLLVACRRRTLVRLHGRRHAAGAPRADLAGRRVRRRLRRIADSELDRIFIY